MGYGLENFRISRKHEGRRVLSKRLTSVKDSSFTVSLKSGMSKVLFRILVNLWKDYYYIHNNRYYRLRVTKQGWILGRFHVFFVKIVI